MKVFLIASAAHCFIMSLCWKCSWLRLLYTILLCHYDESVLDCVCCTLFYYVTIMKVFFIVSAVHRFIMSLWWKCFWLRLLYTILLCHYDESVLDCVYLYTVLLCHYDESVLDCVYLYTVLLCHYDESVLDCVCLCCWCRERAWEAVGPEEEDGGEIRTLRGYTKRKMWQLLIKAAGARFESIITMPWTTAFEFCYEHIKVVVKRASKKTRRNNFGLDLRLKPMRPKCLDEEY